METFCSYRCARCSNSNRECQISDFRAAGFENVFAPSQQWWGQTRTFLLGKFSGNLQKPKFHLCIS